MISPIKAVTLSVLAAFGVSACSSDGSNEKAARVLGGILASSFQSAEPIVVPPGQPYIVISYDGGRTPMSIVSQRDALVDYLGPGGLEMTLHNGFLARLRGLGQEFEAFLPESDSLYRTSIQALLERNEPVTRIVEYWIDQEPRRDRLRCVFERNGFEASVPKITERCESLHRRLQFENDYFLDANGNLAGSRQWLHPKALPIEIDHRQQVIAKPDR